MDTKGSEAATGNRSNTGRGAKRTKNGIHELSVQLGKVPPQAVDLEETVLGALMLEKDALTAVIDILKPESFYKEAHTHIYEAIVQLFNKSEPVDLMTVTAQLRKNGTLEIAGGAYQLAELTTRVNSAANIEYHARIITEQSIKRELIRISSQIQTDAFEDTQDVFELLDKTEQSLFEISESHIKKNYAGMQQLMHDAILEIEARKDQKDGLTGVPTGMSDLDRVTAGWQPSDLVIIAARPGMGKTAFVVSCMRNAAVDFGEAVAIFSLEMSAIQLVNRLISAEAELESDKIKKGNLADHEWEQLVHKTAKLTEAPIFIDDTPGLSILELRAKCRRLKAQHDIKLVVIDYLQLMSGDTSKSGGGGGNREQEIASISRALKGIAKELNVPVLALSQLSRAVETRGGDKRPMLSDLRESGSIEQDADMVMFLYRPEYYDITEDEDGLPTAGTGEVIIAKHRNGSLENVKLKFIGRFTKFANLDGNLMGGDYGGGFPSDGAASFDSSPSTMTFQSKANDDESSDDSAPF
ncbi:replicative DNA helicase [Gilvimarinus agarilyticus]|uniref:Replicative DNA helicase n=1 Tax=Reichenbachiella agariperforans TaxID=156994 RepID=A0A1M6KHD6_REIAG|nr:MULTISPECIES: replicative DNA helicase [Reichenbachiella]MBU2886040.1 replicative DNA helicase [Gilvimarinus agarilyticus]MBU2913556.1 replicative DNA helicase [Reichenbachiella agariperforans]RJE74480.1 replicative DNA helicase [Reichenbachiella sp. MSK19-1]SHJ58339.1 replicative DNA helicase [Reichenbachiella agariperforans]